MKRLTILYTSGTKEKLVAKNLEKAIDIATRKKHFREIVEFTFDKLTIKGNQ